MNLGVPFANLPGVAMTESLELPFVLFLSVAILRISLFRFDSSSFSSISCFIAALSSRSACRLFNVVSNDSLIEKNIGPSSASHSPSTAVTHDIYSLLVLISSW